MKKLIMLLAILPITVWSADLNECFDEAAIYYNLPPVILKTIAKNESRMHPLALNIAGTSYYPKTSEEAMRLISTNKSFDIGIMQINRWWFEKFTYDYSLGLNACWNIKFGAYILAYEVSRHGWTWEAIGRYHSPTKHLKERYISKIAEDLSGGTNE